MPSADMTPSEEMGTTDDMGAPEDMPTDTPTDMAVDMGQPRDMMPDLPPDMPPADMTGDDMPTDDMDPDMSECVSGRGNNPLAPYIICNAADLERMKSAIDDNYRLAADITLPPDFEPIPSFQGTLDGAGHSISGIDLDSDDAMLAACSDGYAYAGGFIGTLDDAIIQNITFIDVKAGTHSPIPFNKGGCNFRVGGLFGRVMGSTIENITVRGLNVRANAFVGGLFGSLENQSTITEVHVSSSNSGESASVKANTTGAGIACVSDGTTFEKVSYQGEVSSNSQTSTLSLFLAESSGALAMDGVAVRGRFKATKAPIIVAGLVARMDTKGARPSTISNAIAELVFDPTSPYPETIGGFVGILDGGSNSKTTLNRVAMGRIHGSSFDALPGTKNVGGFVGVLQTEGDLTLDMVYTHIDLVTEAMGESNVGCHYGSLTTSSPPIITEAAPGQFTTGMCDAHDAIQSGNVSATFDDVNGNGSLYRLDDVETWFGPLRDVNLTL